MLLIVNLFISLHWMSFSLLCLTTCGWVILFCVKLKVWLFVIAQLCTGNSDHWAPPSLSSISYYTTSSVWSVCLQHGLYHSVSYYYNGMKSSGNDNDWFHLIHCFNVSILFITDTSVQLFSLNCYCHYSTVEIYHYIPHCIAVCV